jgi:hypothetical protein
MINDTFIREISLLEYDLTIINSRPNDSAGWTVTLAADFWTLSIDATSNDPSIIGLYLAINDVQVQSAVFMTQRKYNGEPVTGVTEDPYGIFTGTPEYHGAYVSLMTYINRDWESGDSEPPVEAGSFNAAAQMAVDYLIPLSPAVRLVELGKLRTDYPDLYDEIVTRYIEGL